MELLYVFGLFVFSYGIVESRSLELRAVSEGFKVCVEVLLLDCDRTYHPHGDETTCASNHITYSNLCHFSQARCAKHDLKIAYSGHCGRTLTPPTTTTERPTTTESPATVMPTTTARPTTEMPTTTERPTTEMPTTTERPTSTYMYTTDMFTTSPAPVTIDPALDIVKQVFCKQIIHIVCNSELDPLCGSDGNFYLNRCTFAKAECTNAQLEPITDLSFCTEH